MSKAQKITKHLTKIKMITESIKLKANQNKNYNSI